MKLIFLHGLGQTSSAWNDTVKILDSSYDIFCPDLSDWISQREPCYDELYRALEEYCEPFDEPMNLCGLSLGGILALQYCIEHPGKVNSLVLIGTQYTMPKRLLKIQNIIFRIMPNSFFRKIGFGKGDFISLSKSMMDLDFQEALAEISCRVLIVCGSRDKANRAASWQLKERIPSAEIVIIADAGHEVNVDNPVEIGKQLNSFFGKH